MGLSAFDFASSFLGGVQERAQEYDDALAKRIQELADKGPSDITKSKYKADYDEYLDDKKLLIAITSAGIDSDRGQMLAGGYNSMEDYFAARKADPDLYHEMFTLGDEPTYTPADYGITNIRDDGSTVTTAGQMFDQFFRPDVHKARSEELTPTPTKEDSTAYFRRDNTRTSEDIQKSREAVKARAIALQSAGEHDDLPDELTVNRVNADGVMMTYTLMKTDDESIGTDFEGFDGYRQMGDGVVKDTKSDWAVKMESHEKTKPVIGDYTDKGDYENDLQEWTYKFNKLMFGETFKEGPDVGDVISGVYNDKKQKVNVQYTGKDTDSWNGMEGYRLFGEPEPEDTPNEITVNKLIDGVMHTYSLIKTSNANIGTSLDGFDGYRVIGAPVPTDAISNLQEKLNEHGEEPNSSQYETVEMYESARDTWRRGYNKILFGVTSLEDSDGPAVGTITSGVFNDKGVKVNVQYTGESTDNFMNMEGYRQFGGEEAADTIKLGTEREYYNKINNTIQQLYYVGGKESYNGLVGWAVFGDAKPVEESYNLQTAYNSKSEEVKILRTGNAEDTFEGRVGWVQIGEAKPTTASKLSAADLKWQPMQVIVDAIKAGGTVTEEQLGAAEFIRASGDSAMEAQFASVLGDWDDITVMVRDFSMLKLVKVDVDGNDTEESIYMTQKNIKEQAGRNKLTIKAYRKRLLKMMQGE